MPDYSTLALSGLISAVVSWSTVWVKSWRDDKQATEDWYRDTHSLVDRVQRRLLSFINPEDINGVEKLEELEDEGKFDTIDEWMHELNAQVTNPPDTIDNELIKAGQGTAIHYEYFRHGDYTPSIKFKHFGEFYELLEGFAVELEEQSDVSLRRPFLKS